MDKQTEWIYKEFPGEQIAVVAEKWLDSSGLARFSRYHSLAPIKEESNAAG
jgi:hypothetical protein